MAEINYEDKEGNDIQIKQVGGNIQQNISENFMENEVNQEKNTYKQFGALLIPMYRDQSLNLTDGPEQTIQLDDQNQSISQKQTVQRNGSFFD